jgi:hypothetical protein
VMDDSEVAKITGVDQGMNVVHLKDPKHIEGFGSNVVHVNVSCGQTIPETTSRLTEKGGAESRLETVDKEEDEDA